MKRLVFALLWRSGAVRLAAWLNRARVVILCYHGVTGRDARAAFDPDGLHVRRERFERQLDYLRRRYRVVSLSEYLSARREGRRLPPYTAVVTFDDGYRNFLTLAAPRLAERRIPASVFLITDRVRDDATDASPREWAEADDESYLSWSEVDGLRREHGFEFGSHTCSHPKLTTLTSDEAERELRESRDLLSSRLGSPSVPFAYPYGDYSDSIAERARALGYDCALTTDDGPNDARVDAFKLRRTLVGDDDDEASFAARVSGLAGWLRGRASYHAPAAGQQSS